ncbi:hypothetical protein [Amycolatopsis anabasis]|uniref:hypothetical protein n=1 Tax=Amycolatopsis anabasis TaxID=1840409 RepID=UPI00131E91D9|nr:hypothetical protein [Amycolatopsis anabasis]
MTFDSSGAVSTAGDPARALARATGVSGLAFCLLSFVSLPLYFVYSGAPPDWNILTRVLTGALGCAALLVFACAWSRYLRRAGAPGGAATATSGGLPETVVLAAGILWVALTFVHLSLEAGTTIVTVEPIDPTQDGALAPGQFLLQGALGRIVAAVFVGASVLRARQADLLPRWLLLAGAALCAVQLAFVPTVYFGPDPADFYAAVGWCTTALAPGLVVLWLLAVSLAVLRRKEKTA